MSTDLESGLPFKSHAPPALRVAFRRLDDSTVVTVGGELDMATAPMLREILPKAIAEYATTPRLFVDLDAVPFMDSWGLEPITDLVPRLEVVGGELRIVAARPSVRRLVSLLGWEHLIPCRPEE